MIQLSPTIGVVNSPPSVATFVRCLIHSQAARQLANLAKKQLLIHLALQLLELELAAAQPKLVVQLAVAPLALGSERCYVAFALLVPA